MTRLLILIRHADVHQDSQGDSRDWELSADGVVQARGLAAALAPYKIETLYSSSELKARQTASLIAETNNIPLEEAVPEFDEHDRRGVPYFATRETFVMAIENFFAHPADIVMGHESAYDARGRFAGGLYDVLDETPNGNVGIVTHGTVMSLIVGRFSGRDPYAVWQEIQTLGMPCFAVLSLPDFQLLDMQGIDHA